MVKTRQNTKQELIDSENQKKTHLKPAHKNQSKKNPNKKSTKQLMTPSKKDKKLKQQDVLSIFGQVQWAPKREKSLKQPYLISKNTQKIKQNKTKKDLTKFQKQSTLLQQLKKQYSYFSDDKNPDKIFSYLNGQSFSIVIRKNKNQPLELLQQTRYYDKLVERNMKKLLPLFRLDWVFNEKEFLQIKPVRKIIQHIFLADEVRFLKFRVQNPQCLKIFSHIKFEQLTKLQIMGTNIVDLEPLTWLNPPNLKQISIDQHHITSLKSLNKTNFTNCEYLSIKNSLTPYPMIDRMKIGTENGSVIRFMRSDSRGFELRYYFQNLDFFSNIMDIRMMAKVQGNFDTLQKKFYRYAIKQPKAFFALKRKQHIADSDVEDRDHGLSSQEQEYEEENNDLEQEQVLNENQQNNQDEQD